MIFTLVTIHNNIVFKAILYIKINLYNTNDIHFSILINIINFISKKNLIYGYIITINLKTNI